MAIGEVEKTIDVDLPVRTVYNQWTMFEEFPRFMEGIERVEQLTPERLRWYARIGGRPREWEARIVEQIPDRRIVWKAEHGDPNSGAVAFSEVDGGTRVGLHIEYDPDGIAENAGDALGIVSRRVEGDLRRFKEYLEDIGHEAGGWRGSTRPQADDRSTARTMAAKAERALDASPSGSFAGRLFIAAAVVAVGFIAFRLMRRQRHHSMGTRQSVRHALHID